MECIYHKDHDTRYAHIHLKDRWKYPDEIKIGGFRIRRKKPFKALTREDIPRHGGILACLFANDVPYTDGLYDGGSS